MKLKLLFTLLALVPLLTACPPTPRPTYTFSLDPTAGSAAPGGSTTTTATITPEHGFRGDVAFSLAAPPAGITLTGGPASVTGTAPVTAALTIVVAADVAEGEHRLTVVATGGGLTRTATFTLTVTPPPPSPLGRGEVDQVVESTARELITLVPTFRDDPGVVAVEALLPLLFGFAPMPPPMLPAPESALEPLLQALSQPQEADQEVRRLPRGLWRYDEVSGTFVLEEERDELIVIWPANGQEAQVVIDWDAHSPTTVATYRSGYLDPNGQWVYRDARQEMPTGMNLKMTVAAFEAANIDLRADYWQCAELGRILEPTSVEVSGSSSLLDTLELSLTVTDNPGANDALRTSGEVSAGGKVALDWDVVVQGEIIRDEHGCFLTGAVPSSGNLDLGLAVTTDAIDHDFRFSLNSPALDLLAEEPWADISGSFTVDGRPAVTFSGRLDATYEQDEWGFRWITAIGENVTLTFGDETSATLWEFLQALELELE